MNEEVMALSDHRARCRHLVLGSFLAIAVVPAILLRKYPADQALTMRGCSVTWCPSRSSLRTSERRRPSALSWSK